MLRLTALPITLALLSSTAIHATDILVGPSGSIQAAIQSAGPGDRVLVQPGTYVEQIDFLGKAIEVIGLQGAGVTTIDGGGQAPVVRFVQGEGVNTRLQGFSITRGASSQSTGGVLVAAPATPTIEDCRIHGNSGRYGGGLSGNPILRRCIIESNVANVTHGGGVYGAPRMIHCVVANNRCSNAFGGGAYFTADTSIEDTLFIGNAAVLTARHGGGAYVANNVHVTFHRCLFQGNYVVAGRYAGLGGALFVVSPGSVLSNCTVLDNMLSGSSTSGGAVYGPITIENSIVRGNATPSLDGFAAVRYSNVEGAAVTGPGNVDVDPRFVDATGFDFHLDFGSPCIDAGDPSLQDPDGSRLDMGIHSFATLYTRANTTAADWIDPSWPEISAMVGGKQTMQTLQTPAEGGDFYVVLGTISGTAPGFSLFGTTVPLNPDDYFALTLEQPNSPWLRDSFGVLDGAGRAVTSFSLPALNLTVANPPTFHHAMMSVASATATQLSSVSSPLELTIVR
ncbi:MAG: hypothetical protein H6834_05070 [Planctomycetes bacterium]|nr:hypothetical protein [Planctomycetota bacterium]